MTDGTTGIQVTPMAENDIMKLRDAARSFLASLDGLLSLPATVRELQSKVDELAAARTFDETSISHMSGQINSQADQIALLRTERDALVSELREVCEAREGLVRANTGLHQNVTDLSGQLDLARRDRDDAQLRVMELEDELKATKGQLTKLVDAYEAVFNPPKPNVEPVKPDVIDPPIPANDPPHEEPSLQSAPAEAVQSPASVTEEDRQSYHEEIFGKPVTHPFT